MARHGDDIAEELRKQLENALFTWDLLGRSPQGLVYSVRGQDKAKSKAVLLRQMELNAAQGEWLAAGSLREVEEEIPVVLREHGMGTV